MSEAITRTIGNYEYEFRLIPAGKGVKVVNRLSAAGGVGSLAEADLDFCMDAVLGDYASVRLPDGRAPNLTKAFIDDHFRGRIGELMGVFAAALEVNFSDFFAAAKNANAKTASRGPEPTPPNA